MPILVFRSSWYDKLEFFFQNISISLRVIVLVRMTTTNATAECPRCRRSTADDALLDTLSSICCCCCCCLSTHSLSFSKLRSLSTVNAHYRDKSRAWPSFARIQMPMHKTPVGLYIACHLQDKTFMHKLNWAIQPKDIGVARKIWSTRSKF